MGAARNTVTPIDVLHNCRGKAVSLELVSGETVNGTVMRTDRAMNVILKQCIRTGAAGDTFWKARECLVRGTSIRNVRMEESALRVVNATQAAAAAAARKKHRAALGKMERDSRRGSDGAAHRGRATRQSRRAA